MYWIRLFTLANFNEEYMLPNNKYLLHLISQIEDHLCQSLKPLLGQGISNAIHFR